MYVSHTPTSTPLITSSPLTQSAQETFDYDHRVVSQRGGASGRFTFTAQAPGEHRICFTPSSNSGRSNWLSTSSANGGIRLTLDLAIGETSHIESSDKNKLEDLAGRVSDLNNRLEDIRREQVFQRVSDYHILTQGTLVDRPRGRE